jgi:hypothetical protein
MGEETERCLVVDSGHFQGIVSPPGTRQGERKKGKVRGRHLREVRSPERKPRLNDPG